MSNTFKETNQVTQANNLNYIALDNRRALVKHSLPLEKELESSKSKN